MITLRKATLNDLELLRRWDEQPHVIAANPNDDWGWEHELDRDPAWRESLIAEVSSRPVGFVEILNPARDEERYWGDMPEGYRAIDIWIGEPGDLGMGYGTRIMQEVIERCFADSGVHTLLLDPLISNTRAHRFYERLGFRPVGPRRFGLDECLVYRLTRDAWNATQGAH